MAKAEATVEELVGMIERGELRLPEMQRRYVWRATRVRDLLDSRTASIHRARSCSGRLTRPSPCKGLPSHRTRTPIRALDCS